MLVAWLVGAEADVRLAVALAHRAQAVVLIHWHPDRHAVDTAGHPQYSMATSPCAASRWLSSAAHSASRENGESWAKAERIYYEDQIGWAVSEYRALWQYLNHLAEYVGPTPARSQTREHRSARIKAEKNGECDEELASIDVDRLPPESRWLLRAVLLSQQRYDLALARYENLSMLDRAIASVRLVGSAQYPAAVLEVGWSGFVGPDCAFGHSEVQLREQLGDRYLAFEDYMLLRAHPICTGKSPCTEAHGHVYYPHDVVYFLEHRGLAEDNPCQ